MTVPFRILSLLLCLLIARPMSASAHAVARPETRVGNFFPASSKSASADLDQTAGTRWESRGCGYDFASGVCKYLYCHADPVNRIDPSGHKSAFSRADAAAIGMEVHKRVGQDFISKTPPGHLRYTAASVFSALDRPNPPSGGMIDGVTRLFPDLIDRTHKQIYEIKPLSAGGVARGIVQIRTYLWALNKLDPTGGWGVAYGAENYNSFNVFMTSKPHAVITVLPPVLGVIFYEAATPKQWVAKRAINVGIANSARLQQHMGIATMLGLMGGI